MIKIGSTHFLMHHSKQMATEFFHTISAVLICITNGLLKQSGFEGFIRDRYTMLPETRERMMATEVTASWR